MAGFIFYLILIVFITLRFFRGGSFQNKSGRPGKGGQAGPANRTGASGKRPLASDGHRVPKDQDVSCRRFGHVHPEFDQARYIPHDDPEEGFIILNGIKMRLTDADKYEDRI